RPAILHRRLVRPLEQVDELGARAVFRFPHRDDVEVVLLHDAHRVVAEAVVEGLLVVVEDFVDAELVDGCGGGACKGQGEQEEGEKEKSRAEARPTGLCHGRYSFDSWTSVVTTADNVGSGKF